jgi:hypothetical protein
MDEISKKYKVMVKGSIKEVDQKSLIEMLAKEVDSSYFVGLIIDRSNLKGTMVVKRKGGCGKRI